MASSQIHVRGLRGDNTWRGTSCRSRLLSIDLLQDGILKLVELFSVLRGMRDTAREASRRTKSRCDRSPCRSLLVKVSSAFCRVGAGAGRLMTVIEAFSCSSSSSWCACSSSVASARLRRRQLNTARRMND
jgi:hypothetical protein